MARTAEPLIQALESDDFSAIEAALRDHPESIEAKDCRPPVTRARSRAAAELLLDRGASLEAVAKWWAPGFGAHDVASPVVEALVARGVAVTPHAAAGLGLHQQLGAMLKNDPAVVRAKGGDGCTPLHFARDIEIARILVEAGADLEARDDDHRSTPVQWLIGDRPEVVRWLLERGAKPDVFLAAGLGDQAMAERLIDADPHCLGHRIGRLPEYPPIGHEKTGGTIYQWTLAFNSFPHQVAVKRGQHELADYLWQRSDARTRFLVACVSGKRLEAEAIAVANPGLVASLDEQDLQLPARYCWETNTNFDAVKLMLDLGFPVSHPEHSHGYTPLHNAAWCGAGDLVELLIERGHPVDQRDPGYKATPLQWAAHCCLVEKRHPDGDYGRVARALLKAGAPYQDIEYPTGDLRLDDALRPYRG